MSIAQDENGKESRALRYHSVPIGHPSMSVENSKSYPLHDVSFRLGVDLPFVTRKRAARNQCFGALPQVLNQS